MNWYFFRDGNILGPFSKEELIKMKNCNVIDENVLVCSMDANKKMQWVPFNRVLNENESVLKGDIPLPSAFSNTVLNENEKEVVILGMSYKNKKRCVGGIDYHTGEWVRLVSSEENDKDGIPLDYLQNVEGPNHKIYNVHVLNVVKVQFKERLHKKIQTENWLINEKQKPIITNHMGSKWLEQFVSNESIFGSVLPYTQNGNKYNKSITLHKVSDVNVCCHQYLDDSGYWRNSNKVDFTYQNNRHLKWSLTDPVVIEKARENDDGYICCNEAYIVVSISEEPYNNKWYKYFASIIPLEPFFRNDVYDDTDLPF